MMLRDATELSLGVSEFVALLNQTFDYAYPDVTIIGELANLRVSKNKWVYFDLKDESSSVKFFGTVYMLPGPLEDGMLIRVRGAPHLHNQYGFSVTVRSMQPSGEGTIKRAAELLQAKLQAEGLFDPGRKRAVPYPPKVIGLIASGQSAAYADFIKILNARWAGVEVIHLDVQVQGEAAPQQVVQALEQFNALAVPPDVLVLIRGGGSPEDLAAFSTEQVTRAVAASRVPTLVAIGHEVDVSLAELAADRRASTPSNAAELLVPDRREVLGQLAAVRLQLDNYGQAVIRSAKLQTQQLNDSLEQVVLRILDGEQKQLVASRRLLAVIDPVAVLRRGYAIVRQQRMVVRSAGGFHTSQPFTITFSDGEVEMKTTSNK